jgi:rhomboid protease GluP
MFLPRDNTVSVGASTVIFGVMGGLLSYMTINWTVLGRVRSQLCCIVGLITFLAVLTSLNGEVDLAGHLGGMFGGYMCGIAIFPAIKQKDKRFTIVGTSCLAIYLLVMLLVFYL